MRIIFLCSLPRSGSTFLQRALSAHPEISTVSEPWLLIPLCYAVLPDGTFAEYNHRVCRNAISDFVGKLPNKENDYFEAVGNFARSLYAKQMHGGEKYFLEKTPRYYLILDSLKTMFPDAKFVFLFRNPIQVMASVIETWCKGRLRLEDSYIDLYKGPVKLAEGYEKLKKNSVAVFYDDLLQNPEENLMRIFEYLEVECNPSILKKIDQVELNGRMGDKTAFSKNDSVEPNTTEKWKKTFNTSFRKEFIKKYIQKLSPQTLNEFGFSHSELLAEIDGVSTERGLYLSDRFNLFAGALIRLIEAPMFIKKWRRRTKESDPFFLHR